MAGIDEHRRAMQQLSLLPDDDRFEKPVKALAWCPLPFSPRPADLVHPKAKATYLSPVPTETDYARGFEGALVTRSPMLPQGLEITGVLEAKRADGRPLYRTVVLLVPRRATKTTSINRVVMGRCLSIPEYRVVMTAQDGTRARDAFKELMYSLDEETYGHLWTPKWSNGHEGIEFHNGSLITVVKPEAGAFRGKPGDLLVFDEAGELPLEKSENLVAGALPLMDTRPMGQVIIAGTPGMGRFGLLWDTLEDARKNPERVGIVDYSIRDDEESVIYPPEGDDSKPVLNWDVVERVHPGIGTLTTREVIQERFDFKGMTLMQFEREYLCRFPFDANVSAINPTAWSDCEDNGGLPERPGDAAVAFDCAPDSSTAAVLAAWRDAEGNACFEVLAYRAGTSWVANVCAPIARTSRREIAYDNIGANVDVSNALVRARCRTKGFGSKDMMGAASRMVGLIGARQVRHFGQQDLTAAALGAMWRPVGESGRLLGRKSSTADVCPIVAASIALWHYDSRPVLRRSAFLTADDLKDS